MAEVDTYEAPIGEEVRRVIGATFEGSLNLKSCDFSDLSALPAPKEFGLKSRILVISHGGDLEDLMVGAPSAAHPKPPGFEVEYSYEIIFFRPRQKDEDSAAQLSDGLRKIVKLFLNGQRKLPALNQPGCRIVRAVPLSWTPDNPYNEMYDVPEIGVNVGVIMLHVFTRSIPQ